MIEVLRNWYTRNFSNPQVVILALLLFCGFAIVIFLGDILLPLLASIVVAYLLEAVVQQLEKRGAGRQFSSIFVFSLFMLVLTVSFLVIVPMLSEQVAQFLDELPRMVKKIQQAMMSLPESYPNFVTEKEIKDLMGMVTNEMATISQSLLSVTLSSFRGLLTWAVYLILIAILVFFFLKDKAMILRWLTRYMPKDRDLVGTVWVEMDLQIGNYIRGKIVEIIIIGVVSWITFAFMGLNYAALLGLLVGLSVLVPYVGATVVTIPVALTAFFQWGWTTEFFWLLFAYGVIQALDGNVLVPILFSEAVNLHPVAIIIAIIVFGGFWGVWGVFFAIPLATLVKAVLNVWPEVPANKTGPPDPTPAESQ